MRFQTELSRSKMITISFPNVTVRPFEVGGNRLPCFTDRVNEISLGCRLFLVMLYKPSLYAFKDSRLKLRGARMSEQKPFCSW